MNSPAGYSSAFVQHSSYSMLYLQWTHPSSQLLFTVFFLYPADIRSIRALCHHSLPLRDSLFVTARSFSFRSCVSSHFISNSLQLMSAAHFNDATVNSCHTGCSILLAIVTDLNVNHNETRVNTIGTLGKLRAAT